MHLACAYILSSVGVNGDVECVGFHAAAAVWWALAQRRQFGKSVQASDGLKVSALPLTKPMTALFAFSCVCAFPLLPHTAAACPFTISAWFALQSNSNVAFGLCLFFTGVAAAFDSIDFTISMVTTSLSLGCYGLLAPKADAGVIPWVCLLHAALAATASAFTDFRHPSLAWRLVVGSAAGVLCSEARVLCASRLGDSKREAQNACRVAVVASLIFLPRRFLQRYDRQNIQVATTAQTLLVLTSLWFFSFAKEWRKKKTPVLTATPLGCLLLGVLAVSVAQGYIFHAN